MFGRCSLVLGAFLCVLFVLGVGSPGNLIYHVVPASWYYSLLDWKHGDPQGSNRMIVPWSELDRINNLAVIFVIGQSNGANSAELRMSARHDSVYYLKGKKLTRALDPLPGSTGEGGSPWPLVGDNFLKLGVFDGVIFVGCSVGGSSVGHWVPDGKLHSVLVKRLRDLRKVGLEPSHVFWHQGESDAQRGTNTEDYLRRLTEVIQSLRKYGVDCPIFVANASYVEEMTSPDVKHAQRLIVSPVNGIFAGPDTDKLGEAFRQDGVHWNQKGQREVAMLWVESIVSQLELP